MKDTIAELFNFCKDQEWADEDDSDKKTISYACLKEIMESFLYSVSSSSHVMLVSRTVFEAAAPLQFLCQRHDYILQPNTRVLVMC